MCRNRASGEATVKELSEKYEGKFAYYELDISNMQMCRDAVAACIGISA
jgi:hypothetical protein